MTSLRRSATLLLLILLSSAPLWSEAPEARGDRAWRERASGFPAHLDSQPTALAIAAYQQALDAQPDDLALHLKLMEALYFQGSFLVADRARQQKIYDWMLALSERTLELLATATGSDLKDLPPEVRAERLRQVPEAARVHFWAAITWGLWGMSHSRLAAASRGAAGEIRDHAAVVILLDPLYAHGGGLRLLGRLHTATPKVPFFTGWIDRQEGLALLRRALGVSRQDPRNLLFLAEAILDYEPGHREEALALLREVSGRRPDPDYLVEQNETLERARELLAELESRPATSSAAGTD